MTSGITPVVSPSILTPGLYLSVDLLAGVANPGAGTLRVALLSPRSSGGDLTKNTEVRTIGGAADAATAFGPGMPGHLAAKQLFAKFPTAQVDAMAVDEGAGQATLLITLGGAVGAAGNVIKCDVMGRTFDMTWAYGVTPAAMATAMIAAIVALNQDLACTATAAGGAGTCTINAKTTGKWGNDIRVHMYFQYSVTGTETINATTYKDAPLESGSDDTATIAGVVTALTHLAGKEYHFFLPCISNADVVFSMGSISKIRTHIEALDSGLGAKLQQFVVGYTTDISTLIAPMTTPAMVNNVQYGQVVCCRKARSLPCEWAGREVGGRLAAISIDPASNRIGELMDGCLGPWDINNQKPTYAEVETALLAGISIINFNAQDAEYTVRPCTAHSLDTSGARDNRLIDTQNVDATYIAARDIRDNLPLAFPHAKVQADAAAGDDPPPRGVVECRDIKAWITSRLLFWVNQGVISKAALDTAILAGSLVVEINSTDATQVDIEIPITVIAPWAKTGVNMKRIPA